MMRKMLGTSLLVLALSTASLAGVMQNDITAPGHIPNGVTVDGGMPNGARADGHIPNDVTVDDGAPPSANVSWAQVAEAALLLLRGVLTPL